MAHETKVESVPRIIKPNREAQKEMTFLWVPEKELVELVYREGKLMYAAWDIIHALPPPDVSAPESAVHDLRPDEPFEIRVEQGIYVVSGDRVERLAQMTDFESDEALARFEQILSKMGVTKKLRELGVHDGDTVRIAGVEFDYS